jgi:hypothetical protein
MPTHPTLYAAGLMTLFIAVLAFPMLKGKWLAAPSSDQYASAYAVHEWQAEQWRATGQLPLWNPMIMDGLPYVAVVTHGDVLYPTSFLRWFLSADKVTNLGFVLHYILAGLFMFLFLRRLNVSWVGSAVGGLAYQLSGIMISYARPGHDGKLFVSTMLPLACLALLIALRDRRAWGYPLLAVAVALCLLSPHVQTTYYLLIATGLWSLYLTFGEPTSEPLRPRLTRLAIVLVAVIAGFGIAAPQILPFIEYIPHSPRAIAYSGAFESAASYGVPWEHVPGFFLAGFVGESDTYWGSNPIKLHSEYLGLPLIALAILGLGGGWNPDRRRLIWSLGGICILFLLIALSNATPFYKLWWNVMPYVRKTRAPGMVFFVVAFCTAALAAFGTARLERKEGASHVRAWLITAGIIALLGIAGVFGHLATALAPPERVAVADALSASIRVSAVVGAFALFAVALLAFAYLQGRAPALAFAVGLPLLVGLDLWRDGRRFWLYSDPPNKSLYRPDPIVTRLRAEPKPYRVLDLGVYPENTLMAHSIPQVLGYQGNELRYFDELIGGRPGTQGQARYLLTSTKLWDLLAVRFVLIPDTVLIPGYHTVLGPVETAAGSRGYLYQADTAPPYARVVPVAVKVEADSLVPPTLVDPRFPGYDRVIVLPANSPINAPPLRGLPPPSPSRARVTAWDAGKMTVEVEPPPRDSSYVLIAENWYLDWRVNVDGKPGQVLRGDHALLTIPVGPGARRLELSYYSRAFARGKVIALITLVLVLAGFIVPPVVERRRRIA